MSTPNSGFTNVRASSPTDDPTRFGGLAATDTKEVKPANELDNAENTRLLSKIREWYEQENMVQAANRYQMALDEDYYDSMQWTEEDAQELMSRGQAPLVFNEIKPTIDWMIGTERRMRIDHKILPRKNDPAATKDAELKTDLLKYLSDVNKTPFHRSAAFTSSVKAGIGWLETGVRGDPTEELLFTRGEDWRNMLSDSNSVELDYQDGRFQFRSRTLDEDIAIAYFPDRAEVVQRAVMAKLSMVDDEEDLWYMGAKVTQAGQDYTSNTGKYIPYDATAHTFTRRSRVRLTECWYRVPVLKKKFMSGDMEGQEFDATNKEHMDAIKSDTGSSSLFDKLEMEIHVAIFCKGGLLFKGKSPYHHGRLPFVPVYCYRRRRDNAPYGAVRNLRDAQDDLNKRHSKALWIMSSNQVIADEGAVDDWDELREEISRPDSIIVKKNGKSLEVKRDIQLAEQHLTMMDRDVNHMRNVGGVNNENLGRATNVTSGIALQEKKESGSVATTEPFDNLRFAVQLVGEMEVSNIEQFYTAEKSIRITGEKGNARFTDINVPDGNGGYLNDITAFQADYVVSEQDYRSSLRQAMFESLFDIVSKLASMNPQIALNLMDLVVDIAPDIPNKDALVARIRQLNGQRDPDKEQTTEELKAQEAAQQKQQVAEAMQMQTMQNQLKKLISESEKLDSETLKNRLTAMYEAIQSGQIINAVPGSAQVADVLMSGAGFVPDQTPVSDNALTNVAANPQPVTSPTSPAPPAAAQGVTQGIQTPNTQDGVRS